MKATWPLQHAKSKPSELLDTMLRHGAQPIARHAKPVAVVISAEACARVRPRETLMDILRDCPVKDWRLERPKEAARGLSFD